MSNRQMIRTRTLLRLLDCTQKRYAEQRTWTHPLTAEVRVEAGGQFVRSEAGRDALALVDVALRWKAPFREKGRKV